MIQKHGSYFQVEFPGIKALNQTSYTTLDGIKPILCPTYVLYIKDLSELSTEERKYLADKMCDLIKNVNTVKNLLKGDLF